MRERSRFPLMAKVAFLLVLHLLVLAVAFFLFVGWQLQLGLDSLLTGATGERLKSLGNDISEQLQETPESAWDSEIASLIVPYGLNAYLREPFDLKGKSADPEIPKEIIDLGSRDIPERRGGPPGRSGSGQPAPPPGADFDRPPPPPRSMVGEDAKVLFLTKDGFAGDYWAAIEMQIAEPGPGSPPHRVLFLRSKTASANGLFFDYRPWLFGGLAVTNTEHRDVDTFRPRYHPVCRANFKGDEANRRRKLRYED